MPHEPYGQQRNERDLLSEVSQMLTLFDQDRVFERVIELTMNAIGAERGSVVLLPSRLKSDWRLLFTDLDVQDKHPIRFNYAHDMARIVLERGLAAWVVAHQQPAYLPDVRLDDRWYQTPGYPYTTLSALCVPMIVNSDVVAVLTLMHSQADAFEDDDLQLVTIIANQAAVALQSAQLVTSLRQQEQQTKAILCALPDLVVVLDADDHIVLTSDTVIELVEGDTSLIGEPFQCLTAIDPVFAAARALSEKTESPSQELHSQVQERDFLATTSQWGRETGERSGTILVLRDITHVRALSRFRDDMLKIASHDLRSPMGLIIGYTSLIDEDTPEESPVKNFVRGVQRAAARMMRLLDELLRVEQIRGTPQELRETALLRPLIEDAIALVGETMSEKALYLDLMLGLPNDFSLRLNKALMIDAIENLLANAVKYTLDGGRIGVESFVDDDHAVIRVKDTGIGITAEEMKHLFTPFFRSRRAREDNVEGYGLGLSIVKTIIDYHHGTITVESAEDVGTTFTIRLPINTGRLPRRASQARDDQSSSIA